MKKWSLVVDANAFNILPSKPRRRTERILSLFVVSAHIWLEINQFLEVSDILFIANM